MQSEITVRRIRMGEVPLLKSLRLAALLDTPDAYTETHAEALARPDDYWTEWAGRGAGGQISVIAIAECDAEPVGISTGYLRESGLARLAGMWITPTIRGTTASADLVEYVVDWAREVGCTEINLGVTESNTRARRLYEKCGFRLTGEAKHPIRPGSELLAVQMIRKL